MLQVELNAKIRTNHGKGAARTLRSAGQTPAVLYGGGTDAVSLELNTRDFMKMMFFINRRNAIVNLGVGEGDSLSTRHVLVKEVQVDPVMGTPLHADFCEVSMEKAISLVVPIVFKGKAKGVELGGDMNIFKTSVAIKGPILDIPDQITVDVSNLGIGDALTFADIELPANMTLISEAHREVVDVIDPTAKAAAQAPAEDAAL
ncbi:MAG: 50S ribosomal protein L25 [Proteobacteria bacterium]|nr:50S ribosomal protein L25 [Pseudomonadota bacterium]